MQRPRDLITWKSIHPKVLDASNVSKSIKNTETVGIVAQKVVDPESKKTRRLEISRTESITKLKTQTITDNLGEKETRLPNDGCKEQLSYHAFI